MVDVRYHIVSVCAVFLMLGVGILIGEHLALPAQIEQQAKSLVVLQQQVDGAVQDGREAKRRLAQVEQAIDILRERIVPGKLAGKRVVIIQCSDYPHATESTASAISDARGVPAATIVITDKLVDLSQTDRASLLQQITGTGVASTGSGGAPASTPGTDIPLSSIIGPLASVLTSGAGADPNKAALISLLQNERYITVTGDLQQPCEFFVLVGGRNDDGTPPDAAVSEANAAIIGGLESANAATTVVGCEPLEATDSSIPDYQKENIATVDCVDVPLGELDLTFALRGGDDKADYGLKPTAARQLPISLEEQARH